MKKYLFPVILLLFAFAPNAYAALSFVSATTTFNGASGNALNITFSTNSGNLLVALVGASAAEPQTPTDSAGNSYIFVASSSNATGTSIESMFYVANASAAATTTCTFSTNSTNRHCTIFQIAGAATSNVLDTSNATGSTASASVRTSSTILFTTTNANDILISGWRAGLDQTTWTAGAGYTIPANSTGTRQANEYQIVSSIQTNQSSSMSWNASTSFENVFGAFKAAAAATPSAMKFRWLDD